MGELASVEAGPTEMRLPLRMSAAQARASTPENLPTLKQGFQAESCSLFLDAVRSIRSDGCLPMAAGRWLLADDPFCCCAECPQRLVRNWYGETVYRPVNGTCDNDFGGF